MKFILAILMLVQSPLFSADNEPQKEYCLFYYSGLCQTPEDFAERNALKKEVEEKFGGRADVHFFEAENIGSGNFAGECGQILYRMMNEEGFTKDQAIVELIKIMKQNFQDVSYFAGLLKSGQTLVIAGRSLGGFVAQEVALQLAHLEPHALITSMAPYIVFAHLSADASLPKNIFAEMGQGDPIFGGHPLSDPAAILSKFTSLFVQRVTHFYPGVGHYPVHLHNAIEAVLKNESFAF